MADSSADALSSMDLADWSEATFNDKEIPLSLLVETLKEDPERYVLQRSKQYPNSSLLWDTETEDVVIATHAFVVKYASPIETGNFVPEEYELPDGMFEYLRKTEPGPMAQISVTFDTRMDDTFLALLQFVEEWVRGQPSFDPGKRQRNPWMSPSYVSNNLKYTMTSQLFQTKTAFNCKQDGYSVSYPVHSWIEENCYPHNASWIPNPNVVQFYELQEGVMRDMRNVDQPSLRGGDLAKTSFKIVASMARETWNVGYVPIQCVRVGRIDRSSMAPYMQLEDHKPVELPRDGDKIVVTKRGSHTLGKGGKSKSKRVAAPASNSYSTESPQKKRKVSGAKHLAVRKSSRRSETAGKGRLGDGTREESVIHLVSSDGEGTPASGWSGTPPGGLRSEEANDPRSKEGSSGVSRSEEADSDLTELPATQPVLSDIEEGKILSLRSPWASLTHGRPLTGSEDPLPGDVAVLLKEVFAERAPPEKLRPRRGRAKRTKKRT